MNLFECNRAIMNEAEQQKVSAAKAVVIGAGGLGGFLVNGLVRLGVKNITIIDFDVFQPSNANRQLYCTPVVMGEKKAEVLAKSFQSITNINSITDKIDDNNAAGYLTGADIVFDCVDNVETKLVLERQCLKQGTPLIHGGVNGSYGQTAIITDKPILKKLFKCASKCKNAVIMPQVISGLQLNLFIKYIKNDYSPNIVYYVDLDLMEINAFKE